MFGKIHDFMTGLTGATGVPRRHTTRAAAQRSRIRPIASAVVNTYALADVARGLALGQAWVARASLRQGVI